MGLPPQTWRYAAALVALLVAVSHILWPDRVWLDWPAIVLLVISFALACGLELSTILPFVKRLRFGEAEIAMRDSVMRLHEEVENAENVTVAHAERRWAHGRTDQTGVPAERSEGRILALAARDKEPALVLLAIEIEKELLSLFRRAGLGDNLPRTIRETVQQMVSKELLPPEVGRAIIDFRDVRNKVIHPVRQCAVNNATLTSAIDSGIRILRLLRSEQTP